MPATRVIITRPAGQAAQWVDALLAQGLDAHSLPLIDIDCTLTDAQRAHWHGLAAQQDVCMWVSSNAVDAFFKTNSPEVQAFTAQPATKLIANSRLRHWATGPGTVATLRRYGVPLAHIDAPAAQWDSQALWQRVADQIQPASKVLVVRGQDIDTPNASRDWLAQQVQLAGGVVEFAAVYQRRAPQLGAAQQALAHTAVQDGSIWVFSSSQAIAHLATWVSHFGQARCVATHERIAQAARTQGFAVVCMSRPALADVLQSIKSMA